jgi:hypothetical protein
MSWSQRVPNRREYDPVGWRLSGPWPTHRGHGIQTAQAAAVCPNDEALEASEQEPVSDVILHAPPGTYLKAALLLQGELTRFNRTLLRHTALVWSGGPDRPAGP